MRLYLESSGQWAVWAVGRYRCRYPDRYRSSLVSRSVEQVGVERLERRGRREVSRKEHMTEHENQVWSGEQQAARATVADYAAALNDYHRHGAARKVRHHPGG